MMLSFFEASLKQLSVHRVGNKMSDEHYILSEHPLAIQDEMLPKLLMQYFLTPFEKVPDVYRLWHASNDLNLNEVYHFVKLFFEAELGFHEMSQQITKHLYESSNHPKIKAGEVYVVNFDQVQFEGEPLSAIGIFKSETKDVYLKVYPEQGAFKIDYEQEAINIHKLDKGCLILYTEQEEGFKVLALDQTNKQQEAVYWKDDFLQLKIRQDSFHQTGAVMQVCKRFVEEKLEEAFEMDRTDKIELLNRSAAYFKEQEVFEMDHFTEEVLGNPQAITLFKEYKTNFEEMHELEIGDGFTISGQAVKKEAKIFKSILKLDKNFHVYIHGKKELIEKGFDQERNMHYYTLYFEHES